MNKKSFITKDEHTYFIVDSMVERSDEVDHVESHFKIMDEAGDYVTFCSYGWDHDGLEDSRKTLSVLRKLRKKLDNHISTLEEEIDGEA